MVLNRCLWGYNMGVDLRTKRSEYNNRCKWYKGAYVINEQLIKNAICEGVFYCKDSKDYEEFRETEYGVSSHTIQQVQIETPDYIPDITINDYVYYDGALWRVHQIPSKADDTLNKKFSSRPKTITTLILRK